MEDICAYYRYSSSNRQNETSITAQRRICEEWARANNYNIVREYVDKGISGKDSSSRPQFMKMIEDSSKGIFKKIVVYQLDRFARNRYDSATYKAKLKRNGVKVLSVKENISDDASRNFNRKCA